LIVNRQDYNTLVLDGCGWRESWWYHWGAEDVDFISQLRTRFIIHRPLLAGFSHRNSKGSRTSNPGYYKAKNTFPDFLPVVPISRVENDATSRRHILAFVRAKVPSAEFEGDGTPIFRTYSAIAQLSASLYSVYGTKGELVVVSRAEAETTAFEQPYFRKAYKNTYGLHDPREHSMEQW
jgi:hypothetical protein